MKQCLSKNGIIVVELHDISTILGNGEKLDIKVRRVEKKNGDYILCKWPSEPINWSSNDFIANMKVLVDIFNSKGEKKFGKSFNSIEKIYSYEEISFIAEMVGLITIRTNFLGEINEKIEKEFDCSKLIFCL